MKKFFAILLASLILFMNVGLTVSNHYCGGKLAESSMTFGKGDVGCGMESKKTSCENPSHENSIKKKGCCENEFLAFQIDDDYNQTAVETLNVDFKFIAVFITSYINFYSFNNTKKPEYLAYSPPLLDHDVQVMNQTFLI